jgi:hypothetical protein
MNDLLSGLALLTIASEMYVVNYSSEITRQTDGSINVDAVDFYVFKSSFALYSCCFFDTFTFTDISSA